ACRQSLTEKRHLAVQAWQRLSLEPEQEIAAPPELSLFTNRQQFYRVRREAVSRRKRLLMQRINEARRIMITGTEMNGYYFLRICILHSRTHEAIVHEGLDRIVQTLREARDDF